MGSAAWGGRWVLGDAPSPSPPPSPSGTGLVRESQQLEQSPQGTASFYWERSKERSGRTWPGGPVGSEDAATAGGAPLPGRASWRGRFTPVDGSLAAGRPLSKGLWYHLLRVRREGRVCRKTCFAFIWQGDLERGPGCGINYSQLPRVQYLGSSLPKWERAPDEQSRKGPPLPPTPPPSLLRVFLLTSTVFFKYDLPKSLSKDFPK